MIRHSAFILCIYLGVLWFVFEDRITTLIFGHVVYKNSPDELPSVLVILGGVIFWFFIAALLLGKNCIAEFGRYVEAFPFLKGFMKR